LEKPVDPAVFAVDADELRRLEECAKEPIRTPGLIQSHGVLLGVDPGSAVVVVASENAREWLGRPIGEVGSGSLEYAARTGNAVDPVRVDWAGQPADAVVHHVAGLAIVELEMVVVGNEYVRTGVVGAIQRLSVVTSIADLRREAAVEIRTITGFDRVMLYRFHDDGHGEVVAEARDPELEPYLGLHFPASDIPVQARELYLTKVSRSIVSTSDPGIPLLALGDSRVLEDARLLDLSQAELRSVSPYHLAYMRNMGQASTMSLSIVDQGRLVGMITCAHRTERRLPVLLRRSLEVLATQISMQLASIGEIERLRHAVEVRERRAALLAPLYASDDIPAALLGGPKTVLDLVPADGVVVRIDGRARVAGRVPPRRDFERVLEILDGAGFSSECLRLDRPDLADLLPEVAGLLVIPLDAEGDTLAFFRGEVAREIGWLGDPGMTNRADDLSPRTSFSAWRRSVRDRSEAWGTVLDEAGELGHELQTALQRRAEARLAELAMRDSLTGLHNRRYLVERLENPDPVGPDGKALLFVDLDDFKRINDDYGHDVGDAVILEVARRLLAHSRATDVVVRLGGDEFVVLCDGVRGADVRTLAGRIVEAVAAPIVVGAQVVAVTASCGLVVADAGAPRSGLLEAADAAMYRAKRAGRNRVSD
jgi:chemotaxis family two-component system sensor kinase Cph1